MTTTLPPIAAIDEGAVGGGLAPRTVRATCAASRKLAVRLGYDTDLLAAVCEQLARAVMLSSLSTKDNKERVFYSNQAGGQALKLEIIGTSVTASAEGCGAGGMLVYYAYFYEDDLRNDQDGPLASSVEPE